MSSIVLMAAPTREIDVAASAGSAARIASPIAANTATRSEDHRRSGSRPSRTPVPSSGRCGTDWRRAPDHVALRAAEDRGGDVVAGEGDEHQQQPGDDAGHRERERHLPERLPPARAEVLRRLAQGRVQAGRARRTGGRSSAAGSCRRRPAGRPRACRGSASGSIQMPILRGRASGPCGWSEDQPSDRPHQEVRPERHDDEAEQQSPPARRRRLIASQYANGNPIRKHRSGAEQRDLQRAA